MSCDKIGSDILGYTSLPKMSPQKRKELERKVKEELAKKKQEEDKDKEKLPNLPIPNDAPEAKPGEADWELNKDVHVDEHYRAKPKKKKEKTKSESA